MADIKNVVTLTMGYTGTDFTRKYKIDDVADGDIAGVKNKVKAVNASIAGGTDGGLTDFFRADDYDATDPNNIIGKFAGIVASQTEVVESETVYFNTSE